MARLRARLAWHRQHARDEEPPERIPNFPPAVYGEEENAQYGEWVRERAAALGWQDQDAKSQRRRKR